MSAGKGDETEGNSNGIRICPLAELEYAIESGISAFVAVGDVIDHLEA